MLSLDHNITMYEGVSAAVSKRCVEDDIAELNFRRYVK